MHKPLNELDLRRHAVKHRIKTIYQTQRNQAEEPISYGYIASIHHFKSKLQVMKFFYTACNTWNLLAFGFVFCSFIDIIGVF